MIRASGVDRTLLLPGIGWVWLAALTIMGLAGLDVRRHHFETAGLCFGVGCFVFVWTGRRAPGSGPPAVARFPFAVYAVPAVIGLLAFAWAIPLGPLSDDFVLRRWADSGEWTPDRWIQFRPLPLAVWNGLGRLGLDWRGLHTLNIVGHALNSALVAGIGATWLGRRGGIAAGLVFALFPASPEAVAWTAGIFDVAATSFVLIAVTIWLRGAASWRRLVGLFLVCAGGLLCKESAIVLPALLILVASASGPSRRKRELAVPLAVVTITALGFLAARMLLSSAVADHLAQFPSERRQWKDLLVRPFAALAVPLRTSGGIGVDAYLAGLILLAVIGIALVQAARARSGDTGNQRGPLAVGGVWILLTSLPLLLQFYVSPTLQGSRFLYLPSAGFAIAVASAFSGDRFTVTRREVVALVALLSLVTLYASRLNSERHVWLEAAAVRDRLLTQAAALARTTPCRTVNVLDAPDSVDGAYVFREGLAEALALIPTAPDGVSCTFRWNGSALQGP